MNEPLDIAKDGSVVRLTLNRSADGNSIDVRLAEALRDAAADCAGDDRVRCVVITGHGRMFCGGGDVKQFASGEGAAAAITAITTPLHDAIEQLMALTKPVVTLVNGPAAGAGLGLALLGDVVLAARSASFTSAYTALGLTPDGATSWLLPRAIGLRRATEMVLTNRRVGADEAERIGLINRVVDDEQLEAEGSSLAQSLAASAIRTLATSRQLLIEGLDRPLSAHLAIEAASIAGAAAGSEGREGVASFIARRPPQFD